MRKRVLPVLLGIMLLIPSIGIISYADENSGVSQSNGTYYSSNYNDKAASEGSFKPKATKDSKGFDKESLKGAEPDESTTTNLMHNLKKTSLIMAGTLLLCIISYFVYFKPLNIRHREILRAASDRELAEIEYQESLKERDPDSFED